MIELCLPAPPDSRDPDCRLQAQCGQEEFALGSPLVAASALGLDFPPQEDAQSDQAVSAALQPSDVADCRLVYDRGALIALPPAMRQFA